MNTVLTAFEHKKTSLGSFEAQTRGGSKTPKKTAGVYEHVKPHGVNTFLTKMKKNFLKVVFLCDVKFYYTKLFKQK